MNPLLSKLRNRGLHFLSRHGRSLEQACVERDVLCPAEDNDSHPGIYEERDFERATCCEKTTTMAEERARMSGGIRHHGATVLYRLKDVTLHDGWLASGGWRTQNSCRPSAWQDGARPVEMERAACASTYVGSLYFGHWLSDDLPLLLEAERHAPAITTARTPWGHEGEYLDLLGLHAQPLIRAHIAQLTWIDNVAQNSYRAEQYRELRRRLRKSVPPVAGRRVMLRRGRSGVERMLVNEKELEAMLSHRGFEIVDPEQSSALEIAHGCAGAEIVLGVEGSHLTHAFLTMAAGGAIVAMVPPYRFINHYKDLTDCIGMRYGMITGTAAEGGYRVDPDELLRLLNRVEDTIAAAA